MTRKFWSALLVLGMFSCTNAQVKSNHFSDCPIESEYSFIDIHEELNFCNEKYLKIYRRSLEVDSQKYGYDTVRQFKFSPHRKPFISEEAYSFNALDINFGGIRSPINFERFENIEYLRIREFDEIPQQIFNLKNLKVLVLDSKKMKYIPDQLTKLKNLSVLIVYPGSGILQVTNKLGELRNLEVLSLSNFESADSFYIDFTNLKKLKRLDLWRNTALVINKSIANCKELYYLETHKFNPIFKMLPNLKILGLRVIESEDSISKLAELSNLEELYVHNYKLNTISKFIQKLPKLKNLGIATRVTALNVNENITELDNLRYLSIFCDDLLELPKFSMSRLIYLNIVDSDNRNGITSLRNLKNYPNLKYLRLVIGENRSGLDYAELELQKQFKLMVY